MKINKSDLNKALKQISIFVGKNGIREFASLVHFHNKNKKAVVFATDMLSAGRVSFDTAEEDTFDFCIDYAQLVQSTKVRSKEITAEKFEDRLNEKGEKTSGIEFYDEKTKFVWPLGSSEALLEIEKKTVFDSAISPVKVSAKFFKDALRCSGYARNEKDTQSVFLTGVNFNYEDGVISLSSTDRTRIACFKQKMEDESIVSPMSAILSPKTIASIMFFDDGDDIDIRVGDSEIVLSSDSLETYATKIVADYPDVNKFFNTPIASSYEVDVKSIVESLSIISGEGITDVLLNFEENKLKLSSQIQTRAYLEDYVDCTFVSGEKEEMWLDINLFSDVFKHLNEEKVTLEIRGDSQKLFAYKANNSYGIIAPKRR